MRITMLICEQWMNYMDNFFLLFVVDHLFLKHTVVELGRWLQVLYYVHDMIRPDFVS